MAVKATGSAVIFTTHYLQEADVLADRKAVLARGKLQVVGTSRDFKMRFGVGYHLEVELLPGAVGMEQSAESGLLGPCRQKDKS